MTALLFSCLAADAGAQQFPSKPVRFVIGPSSEVLPRIVSQRLSQMWGHQVLVDPRSGGGGILGGGETTGDCCKAGAQKEERERFHDGDKSLG